MKQEIIDVILKHFPHLKEEDLKKLDSNFTIRLTDVTKKYQMNMHFNSDEIEANLTIDGFDRQLEKGINVAIDQGMVVHKPFTKIYSFDDYKKEEVLE